MHQEEIFAKMTWILNERIKLVERLEAINKQLDEVSEKRKSTKLATKEYWELINLSSSLLQEGLSNQVRRLDLMEEYNRLKSML